MLLISIVMKLCLTLTLMTIYLVSVWGSPLGESLPANLNLKQDGLTLSLS